ncbi:TNF receptor-associated factor 3-like [Hydra vulgaris]|uniref:TNF receptor-associated factor 3-like n=1 Tax=Hydra vulgaris TaxID=6087 RepID=A0ABM4CA09_HYDVU
MNNNDENFDDMFPGFGDLLDENELKVEHQLIKKMADNVYPCCFCDKQFTAKKLMDHQKDCSTEQFSHECFTLDDKDYYEHSVICFCQYKDQQHQHMEQIIQDGKTNLNYLNLAFNYNMNSIKNLKEEDAKLQQTLEETNNEMLELKKLTYDMLTNQEDVQNLKQEITKLNQIVEESSTEFLVLKKTIQQPKEVKVIQHIFKDMQIIKLDQMNLRVLSDEAFYLEPIFTSEGYRYCIKIYTRSTNVNNLAIYFKLLRGELDDALKWPFTKKIICTLRDKDRFLLALLRMIIISKV